MSVDLAVYIVGTSNIRDQERVHFEWPIYVESEVHEATFALPKEPYTGFISRGDLRKEDSYGEPLQMVSCKELARILFDVLDRWMKKQQVAKDVPSLRVLAGQSGLSELQHYALFMDGLVQLLMLSDGDCKAVLYWH